MALIMTYKSPRSKNTKLTGKYLATRPLNMRYGPSTKYGVVAVLPKNGVFNNYGYYTDTNGTVWLWGIHNKKKGYCSMGYLKKATTSTSGSSTTVKPTVPSTNKPATTTPTKKVIGKNETVANIKDILKNYRDIQFTKKAVYNITSALVVYSNTVIDLNGATLRREFAGNIMNAFVEPAKTTKYNGVHDVVIKNGTIEGMNGKGYRSTNLTSWMHCKNIRFENVTFLDTPGCHSADLVGCSDVTFKNCKFLGYCTDGNDFREAIQIDYAAYNSLPSYPKTSKCYDMTYCKNIVIDGCTFDKSPTYPAQYCSIGAHSQGNDYNYHENITIKNCKATGNGVCKGSVQYGAFVRCMKFKNTLIENNTVGNFGRMVWITMPGNLQNSDGSTVKAVDNPDKVINVENLVVRNNKIVSNGAGWQSYGMYVKDTFKKSKNIVVEGLNVPKNAVYISGCTNVSIKL